MMTSVSEISLLAQTDGMGLLDLYMSISAGSTMYIRFIADVITD